MKSRVCGIILSLLILGITGLVLLLGNLLGTAPNRVLAETAAALEGAHTIRTERCTIDSDQGRFQLELQITLDSGTLTWRLADPDGAIRWTGRATGPGHHIRSRAFDSTAGEWALTLAQAQAVGEYHTRWASQP